MAGSISRQSRGSSTTIPRLQMYVDSSKETNPTCVYITLGDVRKGRRRKQHDKNGGIQYFRSVSRYDINNAFLEKHLPLSDHIHRPFKMMPPSYYILLAAD
jgi:hypothetical protein